MRLLYNLLLASFWIGQNYSSIYIRIINAPFLKFFQSKKFHHIVIVSDSNQIPFYSIDFSPFGNIFPRTPLQLLFGKSVPGEIRICTFDKQFTNDEIIDVVFSNKCVKDTVLNKMKRVSPKIYEYMILVQEWNSSMNLYTHNCQHFSYFVKKLTTNL